MSSTPPSDPQAEREAIEWLERLDNSCLPRSELEAFRAWLNASEANRRALDHAKTIRGAIPAAVAHVYDPEVTAQTARRIRDRNHLRRTAIGAGAIAACIALLFMPLPEWRDRGEEVATAALELRTIELDDGSRVELSPLARASIAFTERERRIELFEGVAYFDVAADPARPFVVTTPFGTVRVRGTAFVVRIGENGANVAVLRGDVEAGPRRSTNLWTQITSTPSFIHANADKEIRLAAGEAQSQTLDAHARDQRVAWRERRIALEDVTLREAADEVTRFSGIVFDIPDHRLAEQQVSLFLEGGDVEGFLRLLQSNLGVSVERRSDNHIILRYSQ